MEQSDIAIVGGGVMGASAAFWLTRADPALSVTVVERDPSYARAATALSVASIRAQFSSAINVKISRFGFEFVRDFAEWTGPGGGVESLGLRENGYLFLAGTADGARTLAENADLQRSLGAATDLLTPEALARAFPWLQTGDVALGALGRRGEGWFDNMGLLSGLRAASRQAGARFVRGEVAGLETEGARVTGLRLGDGRRLAAGAVVLAAGTRTTALLQAIGEESPVEPRKRTVFVIDAPEARHPDAPLLVDHTGFYLRPEGPYWITATVPQADGPCAPDDFEPDHAQFEEVVWPRLYARAPGFAAVKVLRAWAGHYDYNRLDQNAIVGRWPGRDGLYVLTGFSGHGLQQAPAMGRGIAELILAGAYATLDLSELGPERLARNAPVLEKAVV